MARGFFRGVQAHWHAEAAEVSDDSPAIAEPTVPAHRMSAFVPFSVEVAGDASTLLTEVGKLLADGAVQLLNTALTTGGGVGQPTGIVTALAGTASEVAPTTAETFAAADLFKTQNAAAPRFQAGAAWMMNLAWINTSREFESTNGAIRFPELAQNPARLLNRPVYENSGMDAEIDAAASAANHIVVDGDFQHYVVTQRVGSTVELVPHIFGPGGRPTGQRGLWLWGRWGADSINDNAFRVLSIPTTA